MKYLVLIATLGLLAGCDTSTKEVSRDYIMPDGLKDCKVYEMNSRTRTDLHVVLCPNATTSTSWETGSKSKTLHSVTVSDYRGSVGRDEHFRM